MFLVILMWRIIKIMKTKQKSRILFNYRGACDDFMWKSDMSWINKYVWMRLYSWTVYVAIYQDSFHQVKRFHTWHD